MLDIFHDPGPDGQPQPPLAASSAFEPNDSFSTAVPISEGSHDIAGAGVDWFRFETLSGELSVTMTPAARDLVVTLYNSAGQPLKVDRQPGTAAETITHVAPVDGTYYLQILDAQFGEGAAPGFALDYRLDIDLPEAAVRGPDDPGETMATATTIAPGRHTIAGSGLDWFRYDTGPGQMTLDLTPAAGSQRLMIQIFDSEGTVLQAASAAAGATASLALLASKSGTYYVQVLDPAYPAGTPNGIGMAYDIALDLPAKTFSLPLPFGPVRGASAGVFDIDNDGELEIVLGTSKLLDGAGNEVLPAGLIVLNADGSVKWTKVFPGMDVPDPRTGKLYSSTSVSTAPVFSDVNGDGRIDIVVGVGADSRAEFGSVGQPGDRGGVYALDADGNILWFHQTRDSFGDDGRPDGVYGAPTVFDIDGDGVREVIFASWDHYLYVLDGRTGAVERKADLHDTAGASPALADLNGDGVFEIVIPSDITRNTAAGVSQQGGVLHVFTDQLVQTVPGWNTQLFTSTAPDFRGKFDEQSIWSSAQIVDLDRDGRPEIVVGTGNFFQDARGSHINIWNADGTLRHTLATNGRTLASPLIADLDGNGSPEIIAGTIDGWLHAWRADGSQIFATRLEPYGLPAGGSVPVVRSPVAVDLTGDGRLEILVSAGSQAMVLDATGRVISSTTRPELVTFAYEGSPVVRDIDGDGRIDIITGGRDPATGQAVVYRFESPFGDDGGARTAKYQEHQNLHEIQNFVDRFYRTILGRPADAGGLNLWTDMLHTGIRTGADVARGFILSLEFQARDTPDRAFLETLYTAFFGRPADAGGLAGWQAQLDGGTSREAVLDGFIGSREFANLAAGFGIRAMALAPPASAAAVITGTADSDMLRGAAGNQTLYDQGGSAVETRPDEADLYGRVFRLYQATLGRAPDPGGFITWVEALKDGRLQSEQTAGAFVGSREFQNTYGTLGDADLVALLYRNVLGRAAAEAEITAWTDFLDRGNSRAALVLGLSDSREFINRSNAALDGFMRAGNVSWNDAIEGGAGDDIMNGGTGSDTFIFRQGAGGSDLILGFEPWDNLQLSGFGFRTPGDAISRMVQDGADVVFDARGQTIRFANTRLADMARVGYNLS